MPVLAGEVQGAVRGGGLFVVGVAGRWETEDRGWELALLGKLRVGDWRLVCDPESQSTGSQFLAVGSCAVRMQS
jgi:hypothetical protein